jgi:hypothetical protein
MFGRGTRELMENLPNLDGLDQTAARRLLSQAWLEVAERASLDTPVGDRSSVAHDLRRLSTALQIHAVVVDDLAPDVRTACAFVAAEAADIARSLDVPVSPAAHWRESLVAGMLYLVSGYDANAAVAAQATSMPDDVAPSEGYALASIEAMLTAGDSPAPLATSALPESGLHQRVRAALWLKLGTQVASFNDWLRDPSRAEGDEIAATTGIADALRLKPNDLPIMSHADIQHLARLAAAAMAAAAGRALRSAVPPATATDTYEDFLRARCRRQPLLWPVAAELAAEALPDPGRSAVVAVPTGAGKSGAADLAIQHAIGLGWALYLAPTNALVGQIRRQLRSDHPGVPVREFVGGSEYTASADEALGQMDAGQVLVMTPEKCSLALRQSPEAFDTLALTVFDEAHLLADRRGRGALSELVLSELIARAPDARVLLMSALISNPEALRDWLAAALDRDAIVVRNSWRPTRTLRAVVGIHGPAARRAADGPMRELARLPARRKNVAFDAPLAILAGLQGVWSSSDVEDYALVRVGATTPLNVSRRDDGEIYADRNSAAVRPTVQSLAQLLGQGGEKVMAFLPRSRHDSFAAARDIDGFGETALDEAVEALLALAKAELGVPSLLGSVLAKGVGVHTSALLTEERRASELSFERGNVLVLFTTGTLAQGLNLPATAVIIGGTAIGYDPDRSAAELQDQQRSQLLNAIGRAGRARVAARSLALVVPSKPPVFDGDTAVGDVLPHAEFLAQEDASTNLESALRPFLRRVAAGEADPDQLWPSDQLAISYFAGASADDDGNIQPEILRRSWAAYSLDLRDQVPDMSATITAVSRSILDSRAAPPWAAEAARRAGVPLPAAARFAAVALAHADEPEPDDIDAWLALLLTAIESVPPDELGLLLRPDAFKSTAIAGLWAAAEEERRAGAQALLATLKRWLAGESVAAIGGAAHDGEPLTANGRGQSDPLPRTIRVINDGIIFGVSRAAGLLAATHDVGREHEAPPVLSAPAWQALERLPLALRFGAGAPVPLALAKAGARPRVIAHLLAERLPAPPDGLDDDRLREWAGDQLSLLTESFEDLPFAADELQLIAQFVVSRGAR